MSDLLRRNVVAVDEEAKVALVIRGSDEVTALADRGYRVVSVSELPKIMVLYEPMHGEWIYRQRVRPVVGGLSIGTDMLTGTLACVVWYGGEKAILTNAHVVTPNPTVDEPNKDPITQPGIVDGGTKDDKVAEYVTHKRIELEGESRCPVAKLWSGIYNGLARVFGRKTRLVPVVGGRNKVDAGIARLTDADGDVGGVLMPDGTTKYPKKVVGLLFAGSEKDNITLVCKMKNVLDAFPELEVPFEAVDVSVGDAVAKAGRTTGYVEGSVIATKAVAKVNYGVGVAVFEDVVIVSGKREVMSKPGDSGSLVWRID